MIAPPPSVVMGEFTHKQMPGSGGEHLDPGGAVPRGREPWRGLRLSGGEARGAGERITHPRVCVALPA